MLTVHASGGPAMLSAASQEAQSSASSPLLLAVTALTSLSEAEINAMGIAGSVEQWVDRLTAMAQNSGIPGIVASSKELSLLRSRFGSTLQFVIPGIRPAGAALQDQSRTATPGEAIRGGANYIVVGRPILQANDLADAADSIVEEIQKNL